MCSLGRVVADTISTKISCAGDGSLIQRHMLRKLSFNKRSTVKQESVLQQISMLNQMNRDM